MYADYKLYRVFEATPVPLPPNERVRIILPPISRPIYRNLSWSIYRDLSVVIYLFIFLAVSYNDSVQCCWRCSLDDDLDSATHSPCTCLNHSIAIDREQLGFGKESEIALEFRREVKPKNVLLATQPKPPKNPNHRCAMSRRWCSDSDWNEDHSCFGWIVDSIWIER